MRPDEQEFINEHKATIAYPIAAAAIIAAIVILVLIYKGIVYAFF